MLHLLKIEWLKIKNYRTFWIIFPLYLVSIVGANYLVHERLDAYFDRTIKKNPTDAFLQVLIGKPPYSFPEVWHMASYVSSFLLIIPGLLTIILITNEFNYKTHRQNIIDGFRRDQFVTSKLLLILALGVISTIAVFVTAYLFGHNGTTPFSLEKIHYVGYAFIQFINYCMLALLVSVVFRRSGIAMGVYFLYVVVFDNILFFVFNKYLNNTGYFLLTESADNIIPMPIFRGVQSQLLTRPDISYQLVACGIYIGLFILLSYRKTGRSDL